VSVDVVNVVDVQLRILLLGWQLERGSFAGSGSCMTEKNSADAVPNENIRRNKLDL
jgi:hypothetical protein